MVQAVNARYSGVCVKCLYNICDVTLRRLPQEISEHHRAQLDFLRRLRIKNAVEVLCIILCWGFCG